MLKSQKLLRIDLAAAAITEEAIPAGVQKDFLGGRGLGAFLVSRTSPLADPFAPSAAMALCTGPLAAFGLPGTSRLTLSAKSPLTGTILDSNSGTATAFAIAARRVMALLILGKAAAPSYLLFSDEGARLLPAKDIWGKTTAETFRWLKAQHPAAEALAIGPAGENQVLFANVICSDYGAFGRGGLGALLGSKNLKALAFLPPKEPCPPKNALDTWQERIKALPLLKHGISKHGTIPLLELMQRIGMLSGTSFTAKASLPPGARPADAVASGCGGCPIVCKRKSKRGSPLKYQSLWAMGTHQEEIDLDLAQEAAALCDDLGVDVITTGSTLSCARLFAERGILPEELKRTDRRSLLSLISAIALKEGIGARLAEGSSRLALACGDREVAAVVKGLEIPGFDPRGVPELALAYATSNRGACHTRSVPPLEAIKDSFRRNMTSREVAQKVADWQDWEAAMDSLILCRFVAEALGRDSVAALCSAALQRGADADELLTIGARIWNLERCYNLAAGVSPEADSLPNDLLPESSAEATAPAKAEGRREKLNELLREYYDLRGWSAEGRPPRTLLQRLGLEKIAPACVP